MTTETALRPARKVRSDARLEQLSPEQYEQLLLWLDDENLSYTEVTARLRQHFGIAVGRTAVVGFYRRHVQPHLYEEESATAETISRLSAGHFDAATVNRARYLAYSALVQSQPDIATTAKLLNLVRRAEQRDIAQQRLELARERHALRAREVSLRSRRQRRAAAAISETRDPEASPAHPDTAHLVSPAELTDHPLAAPLAAASSADTDTTTLPPAEAFPAASSPPSADLEAPISPADTAPEITPIDHPSTAAPLQKLSQNPPLYSPYFALNRDPETAGFSPILQIAIRSSETEETAPRNSTPPTESESTCATASLHHPAPCCTS